jgi:hypothetical protein
MYLLLAVGLLLIFISSFQASIAAILADSVAAIAVQVCYYYGLAGLVCATAYWGTLKTSPGAFVGYVVFPGLSALTLFGLGLYALTTYNLTTQVVGIGGLVIGIFFYQPLWRMIGKSFKGAPV